MKRILPLLLLFVFLTPQVSFAQLSDVICDDTARMSKQLIEVVGAEKQGVGLRGPDTVLEVWITPHSGDWTLVQSYANGTSCVVAMGEQWENLLPRPDPA